MKLNQCDTPLQNDENHSVISIDSEKALDKNSTSFHDKDTQQPSTRAGVPALATFTHPNTGSLSQSNKQEKEMKSIQIEMEEVKLSLFTDDLMLYEESLKIPLKKTVITNTQIQQDTKSTCRTQFSTH